MDFAAGSMGPKVEAALPVRGERRASGPPSAHSTDIEEIVAGTAGTQTSSPAEHDRERRVDDMDVFGVHSEVGKLRKVIVHRPELSLQRLTPSNHDELLFDDVLWVERAQYEHDQFVARMRERGVEVFYLRDLLAEALAASDDGRRRLIELVASEYTVGWSLVDEVRDILWNLAPDQLAKHLIGGLTVAESGLDLDALAQQVARSPPRSTTRATSSCRRCPTRCSPATRRAGSTAACRINPMYWPARRLRGLQRGRHLPRPPDVPGRGLRVLVPAAGRRRPVRAWRTSGGLARGRRRHAHRQRDGADRHERAHHRRG